MPTDIVDKAARTAYASSGGLVDRHEEAQTIRQAVSPPEQQHLHIYGSRGVGKTFLVSHVLSDLSADVHPIYLSGIRLDTQYKALQVLHESITSDTVNIGHHTGRLQDDVDGAFDDRYVIVLDEVDFLLQNDGEDLLYFLSRLDHDAYSVITISANHPDLSRTVDQRVHSTLQPRTMELDPPATSNMEHVLEQQVDGESIDIGTEQALLYIASHTDNLRFALIWLACIQNKGDDVSEQAAREMRPTAVQYYRQQMLRDFTHHHMLLIEAIEELTAEAEIVRSGAVYDHYQEVCHDQERKPLTSRRISDFLEQLELLHLVDIERYYGGRKGKTREVRLKGIAETPNS